MISFYKIVESDFKFLIENEQFRVGIVQSNANFEQNICFLS